MNRPLLDRAPCSAAEPLRVAVLASGGGSNLQALLDEMRVPGASYRVALVLVNVAKAGAIARAEAAAVPVRVEPHRSHPDRAAFERALIEHLESHAIEFVVLAGFMRVLTPTFLDRYASRVLNVHPALCPAFPGMHAARQALVHGVRVTGCTVHLVDAGVDTGPILAQAAVAVLDGDDEQSLQSRIQTEEHRLLPAVLNAVARGQVVRLKRGVRLLGSAG